MTLCAALLYLIYFLLFENESMHQFKRIYLPASLIFSIAIPLVNVDIFIPFISESMKKIYAYLHTAQNAEIELYAEGSIVSASEMSTSSFINLQTVIISLYVLVTLLFLFRLIWNTSKIILSAKNKERIKYETAKLILTENKSIPYSFGNYIFLNRKDYVNGNIPDEIIIHEYAHVKQKHSIDIIFIELLITLFWFNPVFYLYRKKIRQNHEFIADSAVLRNKKDIPYYQSLLLNSACEKPQIELVMKFNYYLNTKNRFIMMTKSTSKARAICVKFALIPVILVAICVFSSKTIAQSVKNILPQQKSGNVETDSIKNQKAESAEHTREKLYFVKEEVYSDSFDEEIPFAVVEEKPKFQGGDQNTFSQWVNSKIKYPEAAQKDSIQGRVMLQFTVDNNGQVKNVSIIRSAHPLLDAEALSVIKSSPAWTPGRQKDKPVDVVFNFPVEFRLQ
jgi:TonB family protein